MGAETLERTKELVRDELSVIIVLRTYPRGHHLLKGELSNPVQTLEVRTPRTF
ncbi:hypothetical protein D8674_024336 [Pyrus ussuriensis x Pyrus communis]|uniref:Uncharacterized protein n=1 Tax=Pyrus ussuriensis x Pyrus communis TaxID=2448454 RepID=A0A5N5HG58_9ROSA|nr:hypothetical protein D8674_024336 [Pyrus ussuriensis x Pyrus communis]